MDAKPIHVTKNASDKTKAAGQLSKDPLMNEAIAFITDNTGLLNVTKIAKLHLPSQSAEAVRCNEIKSILEDYSARDKVSCPLSIAVFGPPGSGKSHCVRQIVGSLEKEYSAPFFVNLSQLSDPKDLAGAFRKKAGWFNKGTTRVFFFDEFDAPLNGVSLGWLRLFLAPMQDGEFFLNGQSIKIGKAVFMFAGGTAASLDEFDKRACTDPAEYREKKVPDFISRLRGFIDIQGVNNLDAERIVRRALVLHHLLEKRWPGLRDQTGKFPIDESLVESLLSNVHFVHGARSMEALLDMCRFQGKGPLTKEQLPDNDLRKLHLSRGILDGKTIGISAGQSDDEASGFLRELTDTLLRNGATLAYGGDFVQDGTLHALVEAAKSVPDELVHRTDKRIRNYLGFPSFLNPMVEDQHSKEAEHVEFVKLETLADSELTALGVRPHEWFAARPLKQSEEYNPNHHVAWALSLFRMRARLIQDIDALIVMGGKDGESWGRFSGIAEEVILAVAFGKPVYVLGGRGGAAHAVGRLLGLGETLANPDTCLVDSASIGPASVTEKCVDCFTIPGHQALPLTIPEVRRFLFENSVTTRTWPWNGLSRDENRKLFCTSITGSKWGDSVGHIIRGLSRLDWKLPSKPPS